jgi:hypothetical protein
MPTACRDAFVQAVGINHRLYKWNYTGGGQYQPSIQKIFYIFYIFVGTFLFYF